VAVSALMLAAMKYRPERGARFTTLAGLMISQRLNELARRRAGQFRRRIAALPFSVLDYEDESFDPPAREPEDEEMSMADDLLSRLRDAWPAPAFQLLRERYIEGRSLVDLGRQHGRTKQAMAARVDKAIRAARRAL